ncbi:MAG: hypothetical protein CVV23_15135 [Ignavibacteriae bacterium HGW-Ignavibacteriae-2]|nr:MAG: hypothetical protein CVV23_15135 [Ignavibacteriae bacterium HGW-Ignavibacteriae-2]
MKKLPLFVLLCINSLFAQAGSVDVLHPVYNFISRMNTMSFITDYNDFELPKTRKQISSYLRDITDNRKKLNTIDSKILDDFLKEFEYDIYFTSNSYSGLIADTSSYNPVSGSENYLYYFVDSTNYSLFSNIFIENKYVFNNDNESKKNSAVDLIKYGGELRGTFLKNYGFSVKGLNGTYFGSRSLAKTIGNLRYNYKFLYDKIDEGGVDYFDEAEGYFIADWNRFRIKIGRDRLNVGYGSLKTIVGSNSPNFDYVSMGFDYGIFSFSYLHAKLLGSKMLSADPLAGEIVSVNDKFLAYHRFAFNFGKHLNVGFGEMIIYSRRALDLSYVNPFNYYKSAEHANQDRDNSLLFVDLKNNSIPGFNLFATIMFDDIDFGHIGTSYFGNQMILNMGVKILPIYNSIPFQLEIQYIRIDPYAFTHRINENNYTNNGFSVSDNLKPNSENFYINISQQFHYRITAGISFMYTVHGANKTSPLGDVTANYGGDIDLGHRVGDSANARFLDGNLEYYRRFGFNATAEPVNNFFISFDTFYESNDLGKNTNNVQSSFTISLRI